MNNDYALVKRLLWPKHQVPTTRERAEMIEDMRAAADRIEALTAELAQAVAAESEACAQMAEEFSRELDDATFAKELAAAIRARK